MNIPNMLTVSRMILAFICVALITWHPLAGGIVSLVGAFILFLIASLTDLLDGLIARKQGCISDLGKLLDPIADKILILGVFLAFLVLEIVNVWMVIVIMMREFVITGLRLFALNRGIVLEARKFGKHKTFSQVLGINYIFIILILGKLLPGNSTVELFYDAGIPFLMWYIVIITAGSGLHYLWVNRKIIKNF